MSFKDAIAKTTDCTYFEGEIPVNYQYTVGVAGDVFFSSIKDKGILTASKCSECGNLYIPPSLFCEACCGECKEYKEIGLEGELYTYTESFYDYQGKKYKKPHLIGFVRFQGVNGGIIHRLNIKNEKIEIGMKVKAKLKSAKDRTGAIDDILFFEKA